MSTVDLPLPCSTLFHGCPQIKINLSLIFQALPKLVLA